jgi:hypothetical protein
MYITFVFFCILSLIRTKKEKQRHGGKVGKKEGNRLNKLQDDR